jgi:acetoin utilization protein AcuB
MGFELERTPGAVKPILDDLTEAGARILSIITVYPEGEPIRHAYIRIAEMEKSELNNIKKDLDSKYNLLYFVRDNLQSII